MVGEPKRDADARGSRARHVVAGRVCARLARNQHGIVRRSQLTSAGVDPSAIKRLVKAGGLHRIHRGVYIVGHLALAPHAREAAALLACGEGAMISHLSAAHLWGLLDAPPDEVDVTLAGGHCRAKQGVRLHRRLRLDDRDVRTRHGLRLTSPARTLIDLAADASDGELERLIAEARVNHLLRNGELEAALARAGQRRGVARMRAFLGSEREPEITRSKLERACRRLLKKAGLQQPKANARAAGYEVDFLWPEERVILEVDGYRYHGHRRAFEWDRRKDMALADAGYLVIRITWRQLTEEPFAVIAHIARALDRAARTSG